MDRLNIIFFIMFITSLCVSGYFFYTSSTTPNIMPEEMESNKFQTSLKSIEIEVPNFSDEMYVLNDSGNIVLFPIKWIDNLNEFIITNCTGEPEGKEKEFCNNTSGGRYYIKDSVIVIKSELDSFMESAAIHEVGHNIWYKHLNHDFKKRWCRNYDNQKDYITGYAYKSCEEDFAEAFRVYYIEGKVMPHEYDMIKAIEPVLGD